MPKSHLSDRPHDSFRPEDTVPAVMAKGSLLLYSGKTVHGGGANRSSAVRRAANIDYCVGWVRQEENQYLSVPLDVARTLDPAIRSLMGYAMGAPAIGYVRDYEDPAAVFAAPDEQIPVKHTVARAQATGESAFQPTEQQA